MDEQRRGPTRFALTAARREVLLFWLRFGLLFGASLMPIPWLADTYATVFAAVSNVALAPVNARGPITFRVEPPARIRVTGSWKPILRISDPGGRLPPAEAINLKTLSYRPIAVFLALALASSLRGRRRNALVLGGGLGVMLAVTTFLTALPTLTELAVRGLLGGVLGALVETCFKGLLTPIMVLVIPALVWWLLVWRTGRPEARA